MNIMIGPKLDNRLDKLTKKIPGSISIYNYCKIKNYHGSAILIIPYAKVLKNGFVEGTEVSLDELLLQLGVMQIIYGNQENGKFMKQLAKDYHIKITFQSF